MADLVAVLHEPDPEAESDDGAEESDDDALSDEDADDLSGAGAEGFEDADFAGLLHGHGDEGVHDAEGGDDDDEEEDEEHDIALHVDGFEEFAVHVHPGGDTERGVDAAFHARTDGGGFVGVDGFDGQPVHAVAESVKFLSDVQGDEEKLGVVEVAAGGEDAGDGEFEGEDHFAKLAGGLGLVAAFFQRVDAVDDFLEVAGRVDGDGVADADAENGSEGGADDGFITVEFEFAGDHEVLQRGDFALGFRIDGADFRGEAASHEFGQDGSLHKGGDAGDTFDGPDLGGLRGPIHKNSFTAGNEVGVEAEDFAAELLLEAGHDGNDKDEHHDPESDAEDGDDGDEAQERALGTQVTQGEEEAERLGHLQVFGFQCSVFGESRREWEESSAGGGRKQRICGRLEPENAARAWLGFTRAGVAAKDGSL